MGFVSPFPLSVIVLLVTLAAKCSTFRFEVPNGIYTVADFVLAARSDMLHVDARKFMSCLMK